MSEVERTVAAQVELYGEPLADVVARLTAGLGLSQAQLARTLGMSPPMLSQLGSGKRAKIGNPAVQRRLAEVLELLDQVRAGEVPAEGIPQQLERVRESTGSWTTTRHDLPSADDAQAVRRVLGEAAAPQEIAAAADLLEPEHPALARVLRDYGLGESSSSSSTKTS